MRTVIGGWHVTAIKENDSEYIDQIVIGEGEQAFLEILCGAKKEKIIGEKLSFDPVLNTAISKTIKETGCTP